MSKLYKSNKFLFSIFLMLLSSVSFGFEKPAYCSTYDDIYSIKADKNFDPDSDSNAVLYSGCDTIEGEVLSVQTKDLLDNWAKINDTYIKSKEEIYQNELTKYAINNLAEKASQFSGLAGADDVEFDEELKACLEDMSVGQSDFTKDKISKFKEENKAETEEFMHTSFDKAVLIQSLILAREKKLQEEDEEATQSIDNILKQMSTVDPMLLTTENKFSLTDWFNGQMVSSDLNHSLVGDLPTAISDKLVTSLLEENDIANVETFTNLYGGELKEDIADYKAKHFAKNEKDIKDNIKKSVGDLLSGTNEAIKNSCENKGEDLHYNNPLLETMAYDFLNNPNLSQEQKQEELIGLHAWQCYRWRENPYVDSNGLSWKEIGGMAGIGAGLLLTFSSPITGIGAVAGPYLMMASSGLLAVDTYEDYQLNKKNMKQEELGYLMGWRDIMDLRKAKDNQNDIYSNVATDIALAGAGGALRVVKVPKLLRRGKVAKNNNVREQGEINDRVDNYTNLILDRHSKTKPVSATQEAINTRLKSVSGNHTVGRLYLKGEDDFHTMLKVISDPKTDLEGKDDAFADLYTMMKDFKSYPTSLRDSVRQAVNLEEMFKGNQIYSKVLKKSHFDTPGGPLPAVDPPYKLSWSKNDTIVLTYPGSKMVDGVETVTTHTKDFAKFSYFTKHLEDTRVAHQDAFSFSMIDEASRNSSLFGVMDRQAELYTKLDMVRDALISAGDDVVQATGKYPNLSERQNGMIFQLNQVLKQEDLMPRKDAYDALLRKEMMSEIRGIMTGNISFRGKTGKYGDDAKAFASESLPSLGRKLAPLGLVTITGIGGGGMALNSLSERVGARGSIEHFNEALREVSRKKNDIFYPDAPVRFTDAEAECARELRAWSVENVCLLNLIVNQVMVRERIKDQLDPTYDMATDPDLGRKIRAYIADFYKLREFVASGKAAQIAQTQMKVTAEERADDELRKYFKESALQNGLEILDKDGIFTKDIGDELRNRIMSYNDNPDDAKQAYLDIINAYAEYNGQVIQNPEITPKLKAAIGRYLASEEDFKVRAPSSDSE